MRCQNQDKKKELEARNIKKVKLDWTSLNLRGQELGGHRWYRRCFSSLKRNQEENYTQWERRVHFCTSEELWNIQGRQTCS